MVEMKGIFNNKQLFMLQNFCKNIFDIWNIWYFGSLNKSVRIIFGERERERYWMGNSIWNNEESLGGDNWIINKYYITPSVAL